MQGRRGAVAAETAILILVERDAETGSGRHRQGEIRVVEGLGEDLLRQQQRAEEFGAPCELRKGREEMGRGAVPTPPSSMVPP